MSAVRIALSLTRTWKRVKGPRKVRNSITPAIWFPRPSALAPAFSSGGQHSPEVIAGANEGGGEDRTRVAVNLFGMVELLNLALGHDCYAVGDGKSFFLVVSDIDGGHL